MVYHIKTINAMAGRIMGHFLYGLKPIASTPYVR